jgi:predicted dehydrogenase
MLRVGIVGAGLIGTKRAAALPGGKLIAVADLSEESAQRLATAHGAAVERDPAALVRRADVDAVIVATTNDALAAFATAALEAGKHALVEKPGGRGPAELRSLTQKAHRAGRVLAIGFNHRFHPAFQRAKRILAEGSLGPLMYIRARYGHGGRAGYDREWRADPARAGGGELLDQGIHLIDLCRWLGGEFDLEYGSVATFFWNMPVEDNGFLLLRSPDGTRKAWLHASCTEWKNLFDFEVFARDGKIEVWGLGRSYGTEELRIYRMRPEMGPPDMQIETFAGEDLSWGDEFAAFRDEIAGSSTQVGKPADAERALTIVHQAYRAAGLPWASP